MKKIDCNDYEFNQIKNHKQIYKVFSSEESIQYLDKIKLVSFDTLEEIDVQITSVGIYTNFLDVFKVISYHQFGNYKTRKDAIQFLESHYSFSPFMICRIKNLDSLFVPIEDKRLLSRIQESSLKPLHMGMSGSHVYEVLLNTGEKSILKIQTIPGHDSLKEEYNILQYLNGKMNVARVYYYRKYLGVEYFLRELLDGKALYESHNFGYSLGKELKKIHQLFEKDCPYQKFSTNNLLKNALKNIDAVYEKRSTYFKDFSKNELIQFLKDNKPEDDAFIHGDFSLTNILEKNHTYYYIDIGNASISTKYFDIYVLKKSLTINHLESEFSSFLDGYGLCLEEKYLHWMSLIEESYN